MAAALLAPPLQRLSMADPAPLLLRLSDRAQAELALDDIDMAHIWALTAIAALARADQPEKLKVSNRGQSKAAKFAHAVGFDDVVTGSPHVSPGQAGRTVKLSRFTR